MNAWHQAQFHIIKVICKSCMYRKIMIQIYLLEDVCKNLYVKIILRHYNVLEKIMWTKNLSKKDWDNARSVAQKPIVRHP